MKKLLYFLTILLCLSSPIYAINGPGVGPKGGSGDGGTECATASCDLNASTTLNSSNICLQDGTNCPAGAGGDAVTVNSTGVDSTANFLDSIYGDFDISDGGPGGPDDITFTTEYGQTLAGNPALLVDQCIPFADTSGGGFLCEGSTADTNEQLYRLPDVNGADTTEYLVIADDANVSAAEAGYLDGVTSAIQTQLDTKLESVGPTDMTATDFGDWACNGSVCTLDADTVGASEIATNAVGESELDGSMNETISGSWNFGGGILEVPNNTATTSTDCDVAGEAGRIFVDTDATSGQQLYVCEGTSGWVLQGDGTGSSHADGANCSAGEIPLGVDGSGAVQGCYEPSEADISDLAHTATAITDGLIIEPDLNADNLPTDADILTYDSTGTNFAWITPNAGTDVTADLEEEAHCSEHDGRSTTCSSEVLNADAELYTDTKCIYFEDPTNADDFNSIWTANIAATITGISCESDQTVNFDLQVDDGTPADVNGSDIACTSTWAEDTSFAGDSTVGANEHLDLAVESVSGTPTWVSICWEFTYDD